ncbi:hypothetical protein ACGGZK_06150 [Agromyces sp. MMS24-K17]|uniref:hypothetical protein n=1 Tax=Agromyces sp. MMS24-K17 TaxID=3372850 RepID=UPI003754F3F2
MPDTVIPFPTPAPSPVVDAMAPRTALRGSDLDLGADAVGVALERAESTRAFRGLGIGLVLALPLWAIILGGAGAIAWIASH